MAVLIRGLIGAGLLLTGFAVGRFVVPSPVLKAGSAQQMDLAGQPPRRSLEATVYLPLADNQGQAFTQQRWDEALEVLVVTFGGATLGPPQEGCWLDVEGQMQREPIRPVIVSFAPQRLSEFRKAIHDVGRHLGQKAIYFRREESRVELIPVAVDW
jgi:hypothetical protein